MRVGSRSLGEFPESFVSNVRRPVDVFRSTHPKLAQELSLRPEVGRRCMNSVSPIRFYRSATFNRLERRCLAASSDILKPPAKHRGE
jgi:hypothetical protein